MTQDISKGLPPFGDARLRSTVLENSAARGSTTPPHIPDHELLRKIGAGSYGEVWLARSVLGELRAVKVVYRASFEQDKPYEREFAGIQKFEPISRAHEGHVDILHVGRNDQARYFYYVMELADDANDDPKHEPSVHPEPSAKTVRASGSAIRNSDLYAPRTLKSEIKQRGPLPLVECVQIGLALSRALEHLHQHKLVHRDIKPSNIIFVHDVPKLADIGLVTGLDATRSFVGTDGYIPPEGPGTPPADLYSLGKVLYEMSTGKDRHDFPELPPEWRTSEDREQLLEFNEVVLKACDSEVGQRYRAAAQLDADLVLLQRGQSVRRRLAIRRRWEVVKKLSFCATLVIVSAAIYFTTIGRVRKAPKAEAVELYKLGRWHFSQLTDESLKKAVDCLTRATEIDPNYAEPYATLFAIGSWYARDGDQKDWNKRIASKLMELAPNLAESHVALSWVKWSEGDWPGAVREVRVATKLDPKSDPAHSFCCYYLSLLGRVSEGHEAARLALKNDPASRILATLAGFPFVAARDYDAAIAQFRKALDLDGSFPRAHVWLGKMLEAKGDYLGAIDEFEKSDLSSGEKETIAHAEADQLRKAYASGPQSYWQTALELQQAAETGTNKMNLSRAVRWSIPGIYAKLGERERALELLEKDYREGERNDALKFDPIYDHLRTDPRFRALLVRLGLEK